MRILSIGSDRSLFDPQSESVRRQVAYGSVFGELHIIVFSRRDSRPPQALAAGVHIHPTNSRSRFLYIWDAFRIAKTLPKPDVVTVQDPFESGFAGLVIARYFKVPLHVQVHTDPYHSAFAGTPLNRIRLLIAGFVFHRAARIRAVSERVRASIRARHRLSAPVTVLPIFVDIRRYREAVPGSLQERFQQFATRVVVVSRLEPEKNVKLAIESFRTSSPPDACLVIVGDGSGREYLEKSAGERVFFEGAQEAAPYYALADLVLVTSAYEGYGRTIIEALAAGKPVLSTDVGIAREAGAIIAGEDFAASLREWFQRGERAGTLKDYPYSSFDEYVQRYCDDVTAAKK